ncbi:MAG TPA: tyrosine-type recombinase/integrase [Chloroflexota bacterium]|nr:tyrosine-type recombinase/integrase [Chloroflexota bacterium]
MDQAILEQVEQYLQHLETDISASPNTVAAYRNDLSQLSQYLLTSSSRFDEQIAVDASFGPGADWTTVSRARLVGFVVSLKEKGYAATTVARKIAALKSFFHYLYSSGIVSVDPTDSLDSPRIDKVVPRGLSHSEVSGLFDQSGGRSLPDDVRDNAMLRLLYSSGLRVSELVALNVVDVDLSSGYVRCVNRSGRERIIPLDPDAVQALRDYLESGRNALIRRREEPALFVNRRGDRLTRQGFWLILKDIARSAGLSADVTPQSLRHSFAIRLLRDNTDLRAVQELLGHANITTTQIYSQASTRANPIPLAHPVRLVATKS